MPKPAKVKDDLDFNDLPQTTEVRPVARWFERRL
jgi:hypothetical protein